MAAFMGGLLGGIGKGLLDRERKQHEDKVRDNESRQRILQSVMNNPDTRPEDKQAILKILITPADEAKGKGKGKGQGKNPLHDFLDRLGGDIGGPRGGKSQRAPTRGSAGQGRDTNKNPPHLDPGGSPEI